MPFDLINPTTGDVLTTIDLMTQPEAEAVIEKAAVVQRIWQRTSSAERAEPMRRVAQALRDNTDRLAHLMAMEMGKPLAAGRGEAEKCAWVCEFYAEHAERFLSDEPVKTDATRSRIVYRPLGLIFAVMPWNFPFWQVFRFAAPALMAGNGAVLKPALNIAGCALEIEKLFAEAGFPEHLFSTILVEHDVAGELIAMDAIQGVTLTGSVRAGRAVASTAGQALKKTVLELGGSDPFIVLEDADLDHAVELAVQGRLQNSGQTCVAAKRFIVVDAVREAFESKFVEAMRHKVIGSPLDPATDVGPLARHYLRDTLHEQVQQSINGGARCLLGGRVPEGPGAYYPPTVLTDVPPGTPAYADELFGPVASIIPVADEAEAIRVANDTRFGLGAVVCTQDLERGERIAAYELEAGNCFVNALVKSDPRLPFGGIKNSGYGRELSAHGIREFVNIKTVYVA
ncbi:MAG: NAD-dependent succinate-semialdehyde dehydrogenase [Rhodothermales bacterium]